jgi:hypothetical protein
MQPLAIANYITRSLRSPNSCRIAGTRPCSLLNLLGLLESGYPLLRQPPRLEQLADFTFHERPLFIWKPQIRDQRLWAQSPLQQLSEDIHCLPQLYCPAARIRTRTPISSKRVFEPCLRKVFSALLIHVILLYHGCLV